MGSIMGSTELKIDKLTEDNYFSWVVEAEAALSMKGMWSAGTKQACHPPGAQGP